MASGVYTIPKIETDITTVVTNTTPIGPFRGAGRPEASQMLERAMDMLAAELGLDPAELRRRNFIRPTPSRTPPRRAPRYDSATTRARSTSRSSPPATRSCATSRSRRRDKGDPNQLGVGLCVYVEVTNGLGEKEFGAVRDHRAEGEAVLRTGSFSHGQGHETTFAMIVAEQLGMPMDTVSVIKGDTDQVPRGTGTYGSKSTQIGGAAAAQASEELVEKARRLVADLIEASPEDIVLDAQQGRFHVAGAPQSGLSWGELAARLNGDGRLRSWPWRRTSTADAPTFPFGAHLAVVEVDTRDRPGRDPAPRRRRRRRHDHQPGGGRRPGARRRGHGHRPGAVRGGALRRGRQPVTGSFAGYAFPSAAELPRSSA